MLPLVDELEPFKRSKLAWFFSILTRRRPQPHAPPPALIYTDTPSFGSPTPPDSPVPSSSDSEPSSATSDSSSDSDVDIPLTTELPTYAEAAYPSAPRTYTFTQCSPFAMLMSGEEEDARFRYHISVGVNVWMPNCVTTYVRRGAEEGEVIAQLELGISAEAASVTFGRTSIPLKHLVTRKNLSSKSRFYHLDGTTIKWTIQKYPWQATVGPTTLATFDPRTPSARALTVHPAGYPLFDHLVVGLLILMREQLTPRTEQIGGAAGLFNYHPHAEPNDPL